MPRLNNPGFYDGAKRFVDEALRRDGSIFKPGRRIWTLEALEKLRGFLENDEDPSKGKDLIEKLKGRLERAQADSETIQLLAELLYVNLLPAWSKRPSKDRKLKQISDILAWAPSAPRFPEDLERSLEQGVANFGQAASWKTEQINFLIEFMSLWKKLPDAQQEQALQDSWLFKDLVFAQSLPVQGARFQQEALLYIVHPDTFEAIFSAKHKQQIIERLDRLVEGTSDDVDRQLQSIRQRLTEEIGQFENYYDERIKKLWKDDGPAPATRHPRAWIFQCNPKAWDLRAALRALGEMTWTTRQFKSEIRSGDAVFLWESGESGGLTAIGTILSDSAESPMDEAELQFKHNSSGFKNVESRVHIRVDRVLAEIVPRRALIEDPALNSLKFLRQPTGTNFELSDVQAAALRRLAETTAAVPSPSRSFTDILARLETEGLHFSPELVASYLLALQSKRFVILTGVSGTGKTQLALALAKQFVTDGAGEYRVVAVRPDWTDNRGLLGYFNPLTNRYSTTPVLELLLQAQSECERADREDRVPSPYFLILDEMNLAHVEHYFSDFLSCMESQQAIDLHTEPDLVVAGGEGGAPIPRQLAVPRNLFLVGTVNVDETTTMFSPKVLDRAFTLELDQVDLQGYRVAGTGSQDAASSALLLSSFPGTLEILDSAGAADWERFGTLLESELRSEVIALHELLAEDHRHFGYRVANEIARFVTLAARQADEKPETLRAALDLAVLQKVLPKFHGTQQELEGILQKLLRFLTSGSRDGQRDNAADESANWVVRRGRLEPAQSEFGELPRLPRCAAKVWRMLQRLEQQGFTSFIE